jgi:hypothetical protein
MSSTLEAPPLKALRHRNRIPHFYFCLREEGVAVSHPGMKLEALVEEGEEPPTFTHDGKGGLRFCPCMT